MVCRVDRGFLDGLLEFRVSASATSEGVKTTTTFAVASLLLKTAAACYLTVRSDIPWMWEVAHPVLGRDFLLMI